jgi:hypothetical protein
MCSGTRNRTGAKFQMARTPPFHEQLRHRLRLLGRNGDDADQDVHPLGQVGQFAQASTCLPWIFRPILAGSLSKAATIFRPHSSNFR